MNIVAAPFDGIQLSESDVGNALKNAQSHLRVIEHDLLLIDIRCDVFRSQLNSIESAPGRWFATRIGHAILGRVSSFVRSMTSREKVVRATTSPPRQF